MLLTSIKPKIHTGFEYFVFMPLVLTIKYKACKGKEEKENKLIIILICRNQALQVLAIPCTIVIYSLNNFILPLT